MGFKFSEGHRLFFLFILLLFFILFLLIDLFIFVEGHRLVLLPYNLCLFVSHTLYQADSTLSYQVYCFSFSGEDCARPFKIV